MFRGRGKIFEKSRNGEVGLVLGRGVGTEAFDPDDAGLGAEPSPLAFGILAGAELHVRDGLGGGCAAVQVIEGLFVAEGFKGLGGGRGAVGEEGAHFVEQAAGPDLFAAKVELAVEFVARRVKGDREGAVTGERREAGSEEVIAGGAAGEQAEFEGAEGFVGVVGMDALGGGGIETMEEAADGAWAGGFAGGEGGAEGVVAAGEGRQAFEEGTEVEPGAAAEDGNAAAGGDSGKYGAGFGDEITGGEGVGGGAEID